MRIRFQDEAGLEGEMELGRVRQGDLVRFNADFTKRADDGIEQKVAAGELAEVVEVRPEGLKVTTSCEVHAHGSRVVADAEMLVGAGEVTLVLDARDPRVSSNRIKDAELVRAALAWLPNYVRSERRLVVAALTLAKRRGVAHFVAQITDQAWSPRRAGVTRPSYMPLILWAFNQFEKDFGKAGDGQKLDLRRRRHVSWALQELAADLDSVIPSNPLHWQDEDEQNAALIEEVMELKRAIDGTTDEEWVRTLPSMASLMDDDELELEYRRRMGLPTPKRDLQKETQQVVDFLSGKPSAPATPAPTPAPAPAPVEPSPIIDELADQVPEETTPGEIVLEEPPAPETLEPAPPPAPPAPEAPKAIPRPPETSRYDVPAFGATEKGPHEWAEPINIAIRMRGKPGLVWAEREMIVENRSTGEKGTVVDLLVNDRLAVDVVGPTGLPKSDTPEIWNGHEVQLSPEWQFPVRKLDEHQRAVWQKSLRDMWDKNKREPRDWKKQKRRP